MSMMNDDSSVLTGDEQRRADPLASETNNEPAASLPEPIYFVSGRMSEWSDLPDASPTPHVDDLVDRIAGAGGSAGWTIQTYLRLKARGHDVRLTGDWVPGAICVVFYDELIIKTLPFQSFVVAIQPDRARAHIAEMRLMQNRLRIEDPETDLMAYYWPQPRLQPRDPARGDRVERIGFVGRSIYLAPAFRSEAFRGALAEMGMELVIRERAWYDYTDLDAILAVRDVTDYDLTLKPASKLVNSWHAGVPALLGPEPAYRDLRRSELDYIEVATPEDALAALRRLKDDSELYRAMVDNGRRRSPGFTPEAITDQWERLLAGPIAQAYERWRRPAPLWRYSRELLKYPGRVVRHRLARRIHKRKIQKR